MSCKRSLLPDADIVLPAAVMEFDLRDEGVSLSTLAHQFQSARQQWQQDRLDTEALYLMAQALENIMHCLARGHQRAYWWLACGVMDLAIQDKLAVESIELQLADIASALSAQVHNEQWYPDREAFDSILTILDAAEPVTQRVEQIKQCYHLNLQLADHFDKQLQSVYVSEALEYLPGMIEQAQRYVGQPPDKAQRIVFQGQLHTLKGSAKMAGGALTGHRLHYLESLCQAEVVDWSLLQRHLQSLLLQTQALAQCPLSEPLSPQQWLRQVALFSAAAQGKRVQVSISPDYNQLPSDLILALQPPMEHVLRNAVVHGIEAPAVRQRLGKPETGQIQVTLQPQAAGWLLAVTDDGRGVDLDKLRHQAEQAGMIAEGADVSAQQLCDLVWKPGLSTLEHSHELGGRGLGMDVVARQIVALEGKYALESVHDGGTTVKMWLPSRILAAKSE